MDKFKSAVQAEIDSCVARLSEIDEEAVALKARHQTLTGVLTLYDQTKPTHAKQHTARGKRSRSPSSRFVLNAIREAGSDGLNTVEIYQRIKEAGLEIASHKVRSLLHDRKKRGILEHLDGGRYRFVSHPVTAANGSSESAGASDDGPEATTSGPSTGGSLPLTQTL